MKKSSGAQEGRRKSDLLQGGGKGRNKPTILLYSLNVKGAFHDRDKRALIKLRSLSSIMCVTFI